MAPPVGRTSKNRAPEAARTYLLGRTMNTKGRVPAKIEGEEKGRGPLSGFRPLGRFLARASYWTMTTVITSQVPIGPSASEVTAVVPSMRSPTSTMAVSMPSSQ